MATSASKDKAKKRWDSQYSSSFGPRRYPRQLEARPTSPNRRNNPHPPRDFLILDRHRQSREEEVHDILRTALLHSAPATKGRPSNFDSIPLGPLQLEPTSDLGPHWSQWPKAPQTDRPGYSAYIDLAAPPPHSARNASDLPLVNSYHSQALEDNMAASMAYGDRNVIMNRGLSPRRAAPRVPGRSLTHYGSFGNREEINPYIGGLDLHASPYNANRGFNQGFTSYSSRESRPMHRHMSKANKGEEYLHNHSIFYSTTPMASGYFIIHPDWVSERLSLRRSRSLMSF